jgi:hypothetical protein
MKCQFKGCTEDALTDAAARGRIGDGWVDVYVCETHRRVLAKGAITEVSLTVESKPARPE